MDLADPGLSLRLEPQDFSLGCPRLLVGPVVAEEKIVG